MGQPELQWQVAQGRHLTGGARKKGDTTLRLDNPGQRVFQSTGQGRPGQSEAARVRPPGLVQPGDVDLRLQTGTSAAGRGHKTPAPGAGAPGGGRRTAPEWMLREPKRRSQQRTRHSSKRGQAAWMEQLQRFHRGSEDASCGIGAKKQEKRQEATDKTVRDGPKRQDSDPHQGDHLRDRGPTPQAGVRGARQGCAQNRGKQGNDSWLDHPGQDEKEGQVKQKPAETHARAAEAGRCQRSKPQDRGVWGGRQETPGWGIKNRAKRQEGGQPHWSIQGQQAHSPGSSGAEHEGGGDKMPTPGAQAARLEYAGKEGRRPGLDKTAK